MTKNTKLTNSISSIKSIKKETKFGNANTKQDIKGKTDLNSLYQKKDQAKLIKKDELMKNKPNTTRNKNITKLGTSNFNNTTIMNESNDNGKKVLSNKLNTEKLKKNFSRRNLSVRIIQNIFYMYYPY